MDWSIVFNILTARLKNLSRNGENMLLYNNDDKIDDKIPLI